MAGIDWNTAILYARLVAAAESVEPSREYSQGNIDAIQQLGYTFLQTIYGDELATDEDSHSGETVTYGFLAVSQSGEVVAALRGTDTILEWIHDAAFLLVTNPIREGVGMTEDGFTAIYESLRTGREARSATVVQSIAALLQTGREQQKVTIAGHSLGGALATLLTLDVALHTACRTPVLYSFASPRVGDHLFAGSFNSTVPESYRIFNRSDLVPNLPPILPLPYEHSNAPFEMIAPRGAIQGNVECAHHLATYLWLLGQQAGQNTFAANNDCRGSMYPGPA